jgi:hypothetical protein
MAKTYTKIQCPVCHMEHAYLEEEEAREVFNSWTGRLNKIFKQISKSSLVQAIKTLQQGTFKPTPKKFERDGNKMTNGSIT